MNKLIALLALLPLSFQAPIQPSACPDLQFGFDVDQVTFGSYTSARYHSGEYRIDYNNIFVPQALFKTVIDKLNAQKRLHSLYVVDCDKQSLALYPDFIVTVNQVDVAIKPSDYISVDVPLSDGRCLLWFAYDSLVAADIDYGFPIQVKDRLCRALNQSTTNY